MAATPEKLNILLLDQVNELCQSFDGVTIGGKK